MSFFNKSAACGDTYSGSFSSALIAFFSSPLVMRSFVKNGLLPKRSWYRTIPKLHRSHFSLYSRFSRIYGAIVSGVPTYDRKYSSSSKSLAKPKSAILISNSSVTKMLASFKSLWTTLLALSTRKAFLIWMLIFLTFSSGSLFKQ